MIKLSAIVIAAFLWSAQLARIDVLDAREAIPYLIEDGKGVPGYSDSDPELAKLALDAWSRESGGKLKFTIARTRESALIRFRWISSNDGLYGEMQRIQVNGKAGAIVNVMPQVSVQGEPLAS